MVKIQQKSFMNLQKSVDSKGFRHIRRIAPRRRRITGALAAQIGDKAVDWTDRRNPADAQMVGNPDGKTAMMNFISQYSMAIVAMGSERFSPRFRNKLMRLRVALHGLVVLVLGLLMLSGIYGDGS
jgi:hypothetical protein